MDQPLWKTAAKGQEDYVKFILQFPEININVAFNGNETPLHAASRWKGNKTLTLLLADPSINVNIKNALGETPLHLAFKDNLVDSVNLLLRSKKDINIPIKNNASQTPVDIATDPKIKSLLQNHK